MAPGALRTSLGISRENVGRWAGCSKDTVSLYEARMEAVGEIHRENLARVYGVLREAHERLQPRKG